MTGTSMQRPIGFRPEEIAALVNADVLAQHAEEAAFLWRLRRSAATAPHYALKDLAAIDRRVEANLVGLQAGGDAAWKLCRVALERDGPGEVFALSILAFRSGDRGRMRDALYGGGASPRAWPGLVSALGWLEHDAIAQWLRLLIESKAPEHRRVAIAASAIHRHDPGDALALAIDSADSDLRARALRAAGELKRLDLIDPVRAHLSDHTPAPRFWAAWSLVMLGDEGGLPSLIAFAEDAGPFSFRAIQLCLRAMPLADARHWVRELAVRGGYARLTVLATGILGDPASVPWLIQLMERPALARLAGEAFSSIVGVDLAYHDLAHVDAPAPGDDAEVDRSDQVFAPGYETSLQWPSSALVTEWWSDHAARFAVGQRYLGGKPLTPTTATEVLLHGTQRQRAAAALELACGDPRQAYFDVCARGDRQQRRLSQWIS